MVLLSLNLFAKRMFLELIVFEFFDHVRSAISFGLEGAQFLNCLCPCHVCLGQGALDVDIAIFLSVQIHLQVIVDLVSVVFTIELSLHGVHVRSDPVALVKQAALVSVHAVQFLQHQIQTLLERIVVHPELVNVFIGSGAHWTDRSPWVSARYESVTCIAHVDVSDGALRSDLLSQGGRTFSFSGRPLS